MIDKEYLIIGVPVPNRVRGNKNIVSSLVTTYPVLVTKGQNILECRNSIYNQLVQNLKMQFFDFNKQFYKYSIMKSEKLCENIIVYMESTIECLSIVLAIWKLGKTYIPINIETPPKRVQYIKSTLKNYSEIKITDNGSLEIFSTKEEKETSGNKNNIAYIIFTSGTTGKPKGVKITHSNLFSLFEKLGEKFNFSNADNVWINLHSLEFDFSIWEIFSPLYYCNNLVLLGRILKIFEFDKISHLIDKQKVELINLHEEISRRFELKKEVSIVDFFQFSSIKEFETEFLKNK